MDPLFLASQDAERRRKEEERLKKEQFEARMKKREAYYANTPEARAQRQKDALKERQAKEANKPGNIGNANLPGPRVGKLPEGSTQAPIASQIRASYLDYLKDYKEEEAPVVTKQKAYVPPQEVAGLSSLEKGVDMEPFVKDFNSKYSKYGIYAKSGTTGVRVSTTDGKKSMDIPGALGKVAGGSDALKKFVSENSTRDIVGDLGFQEKAKLAKQQRPVARLNKDGSESTHMYSYAQVGNKFVAYPTLFPKSAESTSNPKDWMELDGDKAYSEAKRRGETVEFNDEASAKAFAAGAWKKSVDPGEELSRRVFRKMGLDNYDQVAAAKRRQNEVEENLTEIREYEEAGVPSAAIRAKYGKDIKAAKQKLISERDELYEFTTSDKVREAIEESSAEQKRAVSRLRAQAKEEAARAKEMLASINKYTKGKYGEEFVDPRNFEINKNVERLLAKDPIEYSSVIRNLNVAYNTYKLASDKAFTEKTYLNATLDKYAQERYTGAINSLYNSTMSSLKEGDMKRVMAKSLLADPNANPDDPALALELAKLAAKNVPSDISLNQKRLNEAMETNNLEGIWDAISENPFEAVAGAVISSFAQVLPIMLDVIPMTMAAGAGAGAAYGARLGLKGAAAGALAGGLRGLTYGQSMSQFTLEVGDAMLSKAREKYDLTDTNQAAMALRDPEVIEAARTTGLARGGTIGAVDALTTALTGRLNLVKPLASRASRVSGTVLAKTAIDIPSEMLGETLAQAAAGQQFSASEVAMEGVGAFGMNTPTTAVAIYKQARGDYYANIADKMSKSPSFIRHMGEDLGTVVDWTNNMRQTGQINAATQQDILMNVSSVREARSMLSAANPNVAQRANQLFFGTGTKAEDRLALLVRAKNILSSNPTGNKATLSEIDNEINYTVQNKEVAPKSISVDLSSIVPQDTMYMLNGRFVLADEMENFIGSGKDGDKDLTESDVVIVGDDRLRSLFAEAKNMGAGVNIDEYEDGEAITISAETKDELPARFREKAKYNEKNKRWEAVTIKEEVKAAPDMGPITNVVSDEVYEAFQQDKTSVPEDVLNGVAIAMGQNKPLSARQEEIYQEYKDQIKEYEDLSGVISSSKAEMETATQALTAKDRQVYAIDRRTGDRFSVSNAEELAKAGERGMKIVTTTNKLSGAIAFSKRGSKMAADDVRTLKYVKDLMNQVGLSKSSYQNAVEQIAKAVENGADVDSAINTAINNLNNSVGVGRWNQSKFNMIMREITGTAVKKSAPTKDMRVDVNMGESMVKPRDVTYTKKVLSMLSKKFNADAKVINDPSIMKSGWVDYSGPKPTIYINTAYSAVDAPMHEYGHVFLDLIRENNLSLYQQILRETFGVGATDQKDFQSAYDNYIKSGKVSVPLFNYVDAKVQANRESGLVDLFDGMSKEEVDVYNAVKDGTAEFDRPEVVREMSIVERLYPEYNTRQRDEEVIVRLLGQYATKELDERAKSYNAIKEFWEAIKTMLAQAIKMSIKDIGASVDENLIRDTIVPNSTLQYIGMLMANPNLKFKDKIQTQFASTQDPYLKKITDAYEDASERARLMMLSPNAAILAGQPDSKSWNMIVFEDRQKAIDSMDNMLSGVKAVLSELESYMNDSNAVYRDLKDFVEKAGPLYDPYTQIQNNAFLDNDEFLRICKKVSDYIMDPSLERPSNIEMLIGLFGSDTSAANDSFSSFLAAFEIEKSLETGVPLQDEALIKSFVYGLTPGFENSFPAIRKDIESTNKELTTQRPEFHLWSMVSSSKESSLGRAASFFGSTTGNFPTDAIDQKGVDNGRTRVMARQQNRRVKSANDGGDFLASSLVTNPMMRNLNESFLNGIAYVHIPFSGDIEGKSLIRDSKKENFGSVQTGGAQFIVSGLAPNNATTMALGSQGEDFVGFLDANVDAQIKRMSATAAAPTGQKISRFTIDVPGRGPTEYKVEANRSKDGSVYVSFTAGGNYPMTGNAMQSMPMVASEVLRMWAGTPVTKITFSVAMGGGTKRPGGEVRAGVYNLIARRMFGKYAVESGSQYEIIVPDAFRPMVSLDNNAVKDMRVDGPGIVQNDAVNSTKYIIPMLKLLSKKFGTKYQVINDPSIMKNGWVDYNGAEPVIYVNMAYPTKDVAAHEYGHIFIDLLKVHNLTLYKDVVREIFGGDRKEIIDDADYQQFRDTNKVSTSIFNGAQYLIAKGLTVDPRMQEMYDAVMNGTASTEKPLIDAERRYVARNYPDLSIIEQEEEILVRLLGKLAADEFTKQSSLYETMMKFWRGIYDLIRSAIQLSVGDLVVPQSMGADVTLEFLAKALVNPRVVFTDRLKGFNRSTSTAGMPQWLIDMEDTYNRARISAASKMQSPNSVLSVMGTDSDARGQVVVFGDKSEAISVAEEYNSNMNKLFDIAVDYGNNVTPEQMLRDYENAKIQFSGQHDVNEVSQSRSGFSMSWYEDIQQEIYLAFEGQGQMPDAFRVFALMVHPDEGGAGISRFRGWDLVNRVAVGDSDMSALKNGIEIRIDSVKDYLSRAQSNFNVGHRVNPLHTASMIAATTTSSAEAYERTILGVAGQQQPSVPDQSFAERRFKAPDDFNDNNFSLAPGSMVTLRVYINELASRMSFVAIPVDARTDIELAFVGPRETIKTQPGISTLRTHILENQQGDWARDNSAALDGLVAETIRRAKNAVTSPPSSSSSRSRTKEIMVQVPELKDKDTGVVTPAYVVTYQVHTDLESNSFGQGISLRFNVKGDTYLKLENAQQSMPSVIRAAISLWEGTPLSYITFGVSGIGKDSYKPDGTIKRTAKQQREQVYNFFGRKVAGKYYEQSGSGTTILIPETMRPVINNTNQGIKDSRVDLDLRNDGTGIMLNGTPDEEMAGQTLPPSFKEELAKTPAIFPDEYRASDVLDETHASGSKFIGIIKKWANGAIKYKKKTGDVSVEKTFLVPFADKNVYSQLERLEREIDAKEGDVEAKTEEMNTIAKEYYQSTMLGMVQNLLAIFDSLTDDFKAKAKDWYIGANRTANFLSNKYGVSLEQSSAILAVFSPKKEWFNNIADAERFLDVMKNDYQTVFTKADADKVISKLTKGKVNSLKSRRKIEDSQLKKFAELLNAHFKKYGEVSMEQMDRMGVSEEVQSQIVRGLMSLNYPKNTYGMFNPDGTFDRPSTTTYSENSYDNMGKAMRIYKDGSLQNIHQELGAYNKIRNFYNNIVDPNSPIPYVTADTHALSGALGISVSADEASASGLFAEGFSSIYAMTKEAYIIAAQITGYSPREMQSIVWEAVRTGINDKGRSAAQKQKIFSTATQKNKKSRYERTTETINENQSKNPEWGGGNVKIQVPEFLQGAGDRAKSRLREILLKWKQLRGRVGAAANMGGGSTPKNSANYAFLNSRGSIKRSMQVVRMLQKAFPDAVVFMSESDWNEMAPSLNIKANGAYGVTQNGKVYINPAVHKGDTDMFETVIHEFGHLWVNYIKTYNKALYGRGIALAMEEPDVASGKMSAEEMLATMIGQRGKSELLVASEKFGSKQKFKNFLGELYDMLRNAFRFLRGMSDAEIASLTMDEFIGGALMDLFSGVPIPESREAFEATFSADPQFRETESVYDMVSRARIEGYKDSEIARMLEKNLPATPDRKDIIIDALRVMPFDLFNEFPDSFKNLPGGINLGKTMLTSVLDEVKKFAKKAVDGKKPTMAKVRQFALTELGKRDAFKDAPESLRMQMMMDLDSIVNITENKAIQNRMKEYAKKVRAMKKGARELTKIKKEMMSLIRAGLPKTMYTRSDVVTLLRKLNEATYANIKQVQDEVFEFITSIKVRDLKEKVKKQLDIATTKIEYNKRKGKSTIGLQDTMEFINQNIMDEKASPEQINERIVKLQGIIDTESNPDIIAAAQMAMNYNRALMLEDNEFIKYQYLSDVSDFLKALINEDRAIFRQIMAESVAYYNNLKSAAFFDITGNAVDFSNAQEVEAAEDSLSGAQVEQSRSRFRAIMSKAASSLFVAFESIEGLVERISFAADEMFGGVLRSMITNRFDNARRTHDIYNAYASNMQTEKAIEIWGKKYRSALRKNATQKYEIKLKDGNSIRMTMNQMYYIYNLYKDPSNYKALDSMKHFKGDINGLMSQINNYFNTPEGQKVKEWADWQVDELYPALYDIYNPVYMRIYRTRMPWNRYYAGRIYREGATQDVAPDLLGDRGSSFITYIGGESTKMRTAFNAPIYMDADGGRDGDSVMMAYLNDMNFFASHAEVIRDVDKVLKTKLIKDAIDVYASKDVYDALLEMIKSVQDVGFNYNKSDKLVTKITDSIYSKITRAKVALVPRISLTQFTSLIGFIPYIGPVAWSKYLVEAINPAGPSYMKEIIENSPTIAKRYDTNEITRMLSDFQAQRNSLVGLNETQRLSTITQSFIRFGDKASLIGVLPNYLYYKKEFLKKNPGNEQGAINYALSKIEPQVDSVAQSSAAKDRSLAQNSSVYRYAFPFVSAPLALARREMHAIRNIFRILTGKKAKGTLVGNIGALAVYHILMPTLVTLAIKLPTVLLGDWDEDDEDDVKAAATFGNLYLLGIIPQVFYAMIEKLRGKPWADAVGQSIIAEELFSVAEIILKLFNPDTMPLTSDDKAYIRQEGGDPEEFKGPIDEDKRREVAMKLILKSIDMKTGVGAENAGRFVKNINAIAEGEVEDVSDIFARLLNPPPSTFKGTGKYDKKRYTEDDLQYMKAENPELYQRIVDENRGKE
jgi:hypothetical protein